MNSISSLKALGRALCLFSLAAATGAWSQTFSVSATPQSLTIHPGDQNVSLTVSVSSSSYTGPIDVTLTGLPSGITVSPLTLTAGGSGTLTLSAAVNADLAAFPASNWSNPNTVASTVNVVAVSGSTQATTPIRLSVSLTNPAFVPASNQINLPILTIDTNGAQVISKTVDVPGTVTITSADGETSYLPNSSDSDNTATFHVHGNTTAQMPKLPYEIKLNTSLDLLNTMGLSCPYVTSSGKAACDKSKSYILLANYDDKTFLRDWSASALANAIPLTSPYLASPAGSPTPSGTSALMPWAPHSLFVEVYLNGVYEGNYQLIEKVNVDSHRVNITEQTDTSTDVTGGYLMEIDYHEEEDYVFFTPRDLPIGMIDPDFTPEVAAQENYISSYVDDAETALFSSNFTSPTLGWRAYFDEASAVNFYIVNDVMGNVDGGDFYSSDYFYKNVDNPLIFMGPIWDFDISSGNVNYEPIVNPTVPWMQIKAPWYVQWFKDPAFKADVVTQWNTLKNNGVFTKWLTSIPAEAATLEQSQANNFGRWPMQGVRVWPNAIAVGSYDGEVQYLVDWLQLRVAYLDSQFNGKSATTTTLSIPTGTLRTGTAATLTAQVKGSTTPTGTVSFLSANILLGIGTLDGNGDASLTTTSLPTGTDDLQAVYSGDNTNGLSASAVQPATVLAPLVNSVTSLASSVAAITEDGDNDADDTVTFTAAVVGNSGTAVPTGTIAFSANSTSLGTASLSSGIATFPTTNLPGGSASVQAVYSGDNTYEGSTSNAVTVQVTLPVAATPKFSLAVGTYTSIQTVTLTDSTRDAAIYYTTDGSTPSATSTLYAGAITVNSTETIEAIAVAPHYANSAIGSIIYTINLPAATPLLSLATGTYTAVQTVMLTDSTPGATIYYTTNGSMPTTASMPYAGAIAVNSTETIEAIATAPNDSSSAVASAAYTIILPTATPQLSLAAGTYTTSQTVTLTDSTPGAAIYYTTDGTMPTTASTLYAAAITVNSTETIQAIALAPNDSNSAVASALYTITPTFTLAISPPSASIRYGQSATFTLTLTPQHDFTQAISFACSGLPSDEACSFSPATLSPGNAASTSTLTISESTETAALRSHDLLRWTRIGGGVALALLFWPVRRRRPLLALLLLLGIGLTLSGCGSGTKPTVSTVTVTASGDSISQSQPITLTVTH